MSPYISRTSLMAVWCFALIAVLWSTAAAMPAVATVAIGLIGIALAAVPFFLARTPEQTTAEAIREVQTGRSR